MSGPDPLSWGYNPKAMMIPLRTAATAITDTNARMGQRVTGETAT
jgi:hypothetical protein